ncbi:MAG TPA: penicillin-binding transpeptidase domain-containing protein [Chloroflexota bacterium]|nr:penicillin-binding transpeptidase domain-containing protein [Chloroflexota bacterium]
MAYRRRRRGANPWPTLVALVVVLAVGGYLFRHTIESRVGHVIGRVEAVAQPQTAEAQPGATPTFTVTVETPVPLKNVPPPELTASQFLGDWSAGHDQQMYAMLSNEAKAAQTEQQFVQKYTDLTSESTITSITTQITSIPVLPPGAGNGASVQVPFTVQFRTNMVGDFQENNSVPLVLEGGQWRIDWRPSLFYVDLTPDSVVHLFPISTRRGSILDRKGRPLAITGVEATIGVVPGDLNKDGHADQKLQLISQYLKKPVADLKKIYANQPPAWFIPLGDVSGTIDSEMSGTLETDLEKQFANVPGVQVRPKPIRVYPQGEVASHVVGYVSHITADDLKTLAAKGYTADDLVGRDGVEQWAEPILAGQRGGKLAIVGPTNEVVKIIAQRAAVPGDDVVLSLDLDVQKQAEQVLGKLDGSIIVMNPQDNSVLALASYPNFDPNVFVRGPTDAEWNALTTSSDRPLLDRPTEGVYPTGSIFKVITATAGMEQIGYTASSLFDCSYWWSGLPGLTLHNWEPQGTLNLIQSITGSCDPTFYTMGLALYRKDPSILSKYAREFGLGQSTGINGVDDAAGLVPDPAWKQKALKEPWYPGDSITLAIGQDYLQATPIQMANIYSALANNGARRTPILVQKVVDPKGQVVKTYEAQSLGQLPTTPAILNVIRAGMLGTTSTPLGTAYYAFSSYKHPMEVKTGSAENQGPLAHAWFVGYAPPDHPTFLILVMVEGRGESMQIASPMARQLMDYLWPNPAAQPIPP